MAKISKSRFVIREFLDYLKWVRNHRILSCFKAVCALCGWGVDAWHGSSRESRHRQDVGLCAFVVEREKKLRLSPALRCILRARRTFWRWAAGDLCGSDWTETVRLTEACTLTDSSLNALFTFVCVWQNKGEACLVSVRQYLVARSAGTGNTWNTFKLWFNSCKILTLQLTWPGIIQISWHSRWNLSSVFR